MNVNYLMRFLQVFFEDQNILLSKEHSLESTFFMISIFFLLFYIFNLLYFYISLLCLNVSLIIIIILIALHYHKLKNLL